MAPNRINSIVKTRTSVEFNFATCRAITNSVKASTIKNKDWQLHPCY